MRASSLRSFLAGLGAAALALLPLAIAQAEAPQRGRYSAEESGEPQATDRPEASPPDGEYADRSTSPAPSAPRPHPPTPPGQTR